jgi:exopolysaccharide production protein ExoQ
MPPTVAIAVWLILLLGLLWLDPSKIRGTSWTLWIPIAWMSIEESRLPSQWLGYRVSSVVQAIEEGNPVDRAILFGLIVLAVGVLISRSFKWGEFFARNFSLTAFLIFALISVVWSDFPFIAFRKWFRDLGDYLMILVVLSDAMPLEALRTFLRRLYFLLIPLSVVMIKYYPQLSMQYNQWTGAPEYIGVSTSKNTLGALCMMSGIFFFWDTLTRWSDRKERRTRKIIFLNLIFLAMTLWLLHDAKSATSSVCLGIGCFIIAAVHSGWRTRHRGFVKWLIPGLFAVYLIAAFGLGLNGDLAGAVGRNSTFTGRTVIWRAILNTHTNPLVGTGYDSFWLGSRIQEVWAQTGYDITEAHNGYLDVYINLGIVGLFLVGSLLVSSYRRICNSLATTYSSSVSLAAGLLAIAFFYNLTEAAFSASFMCLTFLLGTIVVPRRATSPELIPAESPFKRLPSRPRNRATIS